MAAFVFGVPRSLLTITTPSIHDSMAVGLSPTAEPVTPLPMTPKKPEVEPISNFRVQDQTVTPITPGPVDQPQPEAEEPVVPIIDPITPGPADQPQPEAKEPVAPITPGPVDQPQPEAEEPVTLKANVEPTRIDIDLSNDQVNVIISDEPTGPSIDSFWALSYNSLKKLCKIIGVPASGSKAVLVERASKAPYNGELPGFDQLSDWYSQNQE